MKDDSDREVGIFAEAIKLASHARAPFLQRHCGGDEHLRRKMEALLSAHDRLGSFLEESPTGQSRH